MTNLYTVVASKEMGTSVLSAEETASVIYHNIFDYPLSLSDLVRWKSGSQLKISGSQPTISQKNGYYFLEGRDGLIYKRILRTRISEKKIEIAKKAAKIISWVPSVKMVAITGSLAMKNSNEDGDIDLMIITKKGNLWTTRLLVYSLIRLFGIKTRRAGDRDEKDRLCLNMWLDEVSMLWPKRDQNIYTAHEMAQVLPLINKGNTYEKFLIRNNWILDWWPNSVKIEARKFGGKQKMEGRKSEASMGPLEWLAFKIQYSYMRSRITREVVTPTRALFHPQDWARIVLSRLKT